MADDLDLARELDALVRQHYRAQTLGDERAEAIQSLAGALVENDATPATVSKATHGWTRRRWLRAAAVAGPLFVGGTLTWERWGSDVGGDDVIDEIERYHREALPLDIVSNDFRVVEAAMDRLEFPLHRPDFLPRDLQLVGARYCSLQGRLAVQLKLRGPASTSLETLFVTAETDRLRGVPTRILDRDGVTIQVHRDAGLFFALATD